MLRVENRHRVREGLAEAALELFASRGFEAVTVDEIAERAGVSRRTFFRYFPSKEAALFPERDRRLGDFREVLERGRGDPDPFAAVGLAMERLASDYTRLKGRAVKQHRVISRSPQTVAYDFERDRDWEIAVAQLLGDRVGRSEPERRRARLAAGALLGVSRVVLRDWYGSGGKGDLAQQGREAVALVRDGFGGVTPKRRARRRR